MNDFEKHFEKLAKTDDASTLWTNWLDWVIDQNLIIDHDRKLNFKGNEKIYFQLYQDWIKIVSDELEKGDKYYYDYPGVFYEDVIQSKYKAGTNGQFFTPHDVSKLMSQITAIDESIDKPVINDCACGSGRLLLDAHSFNQNAVLIGQDLDPVACKMAVLNFYISGVTGSILHQNTLTGEFYGAWRVNNYIHHMNKHDSFLCKYTNNDECLTLNIYHIYRNTDDDGNKYDHANIIAQITVHDKLDD